MLAPAGLGDRGMICSKEPLGEARALLKIWSQLYSMGILLQTTEARLSFNYWNCVCSRNTGLMAPDAVRSLLSDRAGHPGSHIYVYIKWHCWKHLITIPKGGIGSDFSLNCTESTCYEKWGYEFKWSGRVSAPGHTLPRSGFGQLPRGASVYSSVKWGKWFCYILWAPTGN